MSTRTYRIFIAFAALAWVGAAVASPGCQAELDGLRGAEKPGLDPPRDRFFFPSGLALTPDGRYLFVSNGNSDLKYNGGTIVVVDVEQTVARMDALWRPDATEVERPAELLQDVAQSCRYAPQNPLLVECHEQDVGDTPGVILSSLTVRTGFYPSFIALEPMGGANGCAPYTQSTQDGELGYRLHVPVRGDPSLTYIDVYLGDLPSGDGTGVTCMDCGEGCEKTDIRDCRDEYLLDEPSDARKDYVESSLPAEPFGLAVEPEGGFLILSHLAGGSLSLVDLCGGPADGGRGPDLVHVLTGVMGTDAEGRSGGFNVVQRDPQDACGWFYVSNRSAAQIMTVRVDSPITAESGDGTACTIAPMDDDRDLQLVMGPSLVLTAPFGPLESGADLRGMAMADGGNRLLALSRTPPSLLVVDTSLEDGQPRNEILDVVEICPKPSVLRVRTGPLGRTLAYTVCFGSGEIYVVDTQDAQVVDRIEIGGGPHDLVLMPDGVDDRLKDFGFVTNFGEHTVGVIDLRPGEDTYHQMIGRLGWPEELMQ